MWVRRNKFLKKQKQPSEVFSEKQFLDILQNSLENTCVGISFFNKATGLRPATV